MSVKFQPRRSTNNRILDALPDEAYFRLQPFLEKVQLPLGQILYKPDEKIKYVYFPVNSIASVVATTITGRSAEVGMIGCEGMVGAEVLMNTDSTSNKVVNQHQDGALRIKTEEIRKEFKRCGAFHEILLHFFHCLIEQISQTALCNQLHTIEERLVRRLLLTHDRAETDELTLTQMFLSRMLGVTRSGVSIAAGTLQVAGFIECSRGQITIVDRERLESFSCDCYRTIKIAYDKLSPSVI